MKTKNELLTTEDACRFFKVTDITIRTWRKNGFLKFYKVGRKILFKEKDLKIALGKIKNNEAPLTIPRTVYVYNEKLKIIDAGSIPEMAKKYSLSVTKARYMVNSCKMIYSCYFSWDKDFTLPKKEKRIKTLLARRKRTKKIKYLLKSDFIKELRIKKGLSREKLAAILDSALNVVWDMENIPFHNPRITILMKLAAFYNLNIEDFLNMDTFRLKEVKTTAII